MPDTTPNKSERPAPYDVVYVPVIYQEIRNDNPLQDTVDKLTNNKEKIINDLNARGANVSGGDFDKALTYLVPKELKEGESLKVGKDTNFFGITEKVSYEDFERVNKNVENVSPNDASFGGKLPRIFIMPDLPSESSKEQLILDEIITDTKPEFFQVPLQEKKCAGSAPEGHVNTLQMSVNRA